ncbi:sulfoxide reductase heme-binding subunit YedZ [Paucibacter sp. PLA-PC-4]|uniref:sulfite oxidase heme-binding subunit YedZ n=1 Tax=Paucibacter sp. PLA-PC-4 TaxID=2993655 RepID=UPI00224B0711|nr:protein-methionine-sulfoxide reductase heme-binding subunit MsrQ [Paucibacter sp. PLA-PC-4]MCX2865641.1 sulfoxide reductase heme-binding subunit YedZ [Paucibacter sp. PLA-PC-4]
MLPGSDVRLLSWTARLPASLSADSLSLVRSALFALALAPFGRLVWLASTDGLGANPVEFVVRSLGIWALVLLCVTLAVSPLRRATGWAWLLRLRRMLGLFTFFYATLHLMAVAGIDLDFDWVVIANDIVKRPFITVGFAAYLLLIPLAVTSTNAMMRALGGRNWQRLHRLVYLIALLVVVHYWWHKAGKNDFTQPIIYAVIIGLLLGVRLLRWVQHRRPSPAAGVSSQGYKNADGRRRFL